MYISSHERGQRRLATAGRLLLSLLFLALLGSAKGKSNNQNARVDRIWKARKQNCEQTEECRDLVPEESMNCVNLCLSPECFEEVYAKEPLEDGEVDRKRDQEFTKCLRRIERERKKAARKT